MWIFGVVSEKMKAWKPTIGVMAQILDDCYGGHGMDKLYDTYGRRNGVSETTIFRQVKDKTLMVYSVIDHLLSGSKLGETLLHFDRKWQMDEKVIPVVADKWLEGGNPFNSYKNKGGRRVPQVMLCNIYSIPSTKFCLLTENVGTCSAEEVARALHKAKLRAGKWPVELEVDEHASHIGAHKKYFEAIFDLEIKYKIGKYSRVHHAEGNHNAMERKMESGLHGKEMFLVQGNWLHKNFVEKKDDLKMTAFEACGGQTSYHSNRWQFLLELAYNYQRYQNNPRNFLKPHAVKWKQMSFQI